MEILLMEERWTVEELRTWFPWLFYDWGEGWRVRVQLQQQVQGGNTTTAAAATMWQGQCRLAIEEHWETLATLWVQCLCGVMWARKVFKSKFLILNKVSSENIYTHQITQSWSWVHLRHRERRRLWLKKEQCIGLSKKKALESTTKVFILIAEMLNCCWG
jgi:hypothetical protein